MERSSVAGAGVKRKYRQRPRPRVNSARQRLLRHRRRRRGRQDDRPSRRETARLLPRLRTDRQPRWRQESDRRQRHSGRQPRVFEEVTFDGNGVTSLDWKTYPILKFNDVPKIEIVLINRPEMPALGAGEPSIIPVAAAIANGIFDAVGVRLREVPFTP